MSEHVIGGRRSQLPEEIGDCVQVTKEAEDRFLVRHFPNREPGTKPCCQIRVTVNDADRAKAIPDADPHGQAAALARVDAATERKHASRKT
jgi:hypothetical protein